MILRVPLTLKIKLKFCFPWLIMWMYISKSTSRDQYFARVADLSTLTLKVKIMFVPHSCLCCCTCQNNSMRPIVYEIS